MMKLRHFLANIVSSKVIDDPAMSDDMDEDVPGTSQEANMGHPAKNWDTLSHRSKKRKA